MAKIYIIMGKSATGKDTVYRELLSRVGDRLSTIVTYTTRPMRSGEVNGKDYYFATIEELENYRCENRLIELRTYQTVHGPWHYFTVKDNQIDLASDRNYLVINTLEAYEQYLKAFGREVVVPLYIEISDKERIHRALAREDGQKEPKYAELCRRFLADEEDFAEGKLEKLEIGASDRFLNTDLETCVSAIISRISER